MPTALDRLVPDAPRGRKRRRDAAPQGKRGGRTKAGHKGATRKRPARSVEPRQPSVWINRVLILVAATVVVAAGARAYLWLGSLPVQQITVSGPLEHTQAEAVQELVQGTLGGGFLSADLRSMQRQLQRLPWIYEASVRRRWPNALEIHVVEQLPIARWGEDSLLNHEGAIFTSDSPGDWHALPLLRGPEGSAPALMERYLQLRELLAPLQLQVEQLRVDQRGQLEAMLAGDVRLIIGGEQFRERMLRFTGIYARELAPRIDEIERIDLRYQVGIAVAYTEPETSQVAGL